MIAELSENPSETLAVIAELSSGLSYACIAIAPGLAFVAPALVFVGAILKQVANAAANVSLASNLVRRVVALQPVLKAAARSPEMTRSQAETMAAMTLVLKEASEAVSRVTKRGFTAKLWNATNDRAIIESAETSIDKWVTVLTSALAAALGGDTLAALQQESARAVAAHDAVVGRIAEVGKAVAENAEEARAHNAALLAALERQAQVVRRQRVI